MVHRVQRLFYTLALALVVPVWAAEPNSYVILGLAPGAPASSVMGAYRRLTLAYDPLRYPGQAEIFDRFLSVQKAYLDLSRTFTPEDKSYYVAKLGYALNVAALNVEYPRTARALLIQIAAAEMQGPEASLTAQDIWALHQQRWQGLAATHREAEWALGVAQGRRGLNANANRRACEAYLRTQEPNSATLLGRWLDRAD